MATSFNRRFNRSQERLKIKIEKQFLERIKGKTKEEVAVILEQIRTKHNLDRFTKTEEE